MANRGTTQFWDTHKPEIDAYISDETEKLSEPTYKKIFNVQGTDRLTISEITRGGLTPMEEVGEMGNAVEDSHVQGFRTNYTRKIYRKKEVFSKVLIDTDQTGEVEKMARELPRAQVYSRELNIWGMVRKAFDATALGGDSKPLASLSHPTKGTAGSQGNTFSDGVQKSLSYDAVKELQDVQLAIVSNNDNLMNVSAPTKNKILFGSSYLRDELFQIAGVEGPEGKPGTAENDMNYFRKGEKFDVLVVPWLNYEAARQAGEIAAAKSSDSNFYDSMWGILDVEMAKKYFNVFEANGYPSFADKINEENESMIKYAYDHYVWGQSAYYPVALSKGDGSTYTG